MYILHPAVNEANFNEPAEKSEQGDARLTPYTVLSFDECQIDVVRRGTSANRRK